MVRSRNIRPSAADMIAETSLVLMLIFFVISSSNPVKKTGKLVISSVESKLSDVGDRA